MTVLANNTFIRIVLTDSQPAKSLTVPKKTKAPLSDSADDNKTEKRKDKAAPSVTEKPKEKGKAKDKSKSVEVEEEEEKQEHEVAQPEKKKKRKLLGAQPAFAWDSIMNVSSHFEYLVHTRVV